ncbi:FkbM family methyltransferase [Stappia sp. MMSF_3263]|uniref:FkbM family methyltransferase n=1 Tax=Stappia sp. MMSF_3263 TaxID=3046693 RepID=UPI00273E6A85|nr:FkbM family methyltransferase [Stappia sp. MMSF_3263]
MGFNLIRFALDPQYRAIKRWKRAKGDERLLTDFELGPASLVVDAGFYKGDFSARISKNGSPNVLAFEPAPEFCKKAASLLERLPNVTLECAGLSDFNGTASLVYDNDGSSTQRKQEGDTVEVTLRRASDVVRAAGRPVDLMKLNIEGDEYPALEDLIAEGQVAAIRHLVVQFHLIGDDSRERYARIAEKLSATHDLVWRYPFIWERWDLRT